MSKTKKVFLLLLSVCFAVSLIFGVSIVGITEGETSVSITKVTTTE